jgi:hypothetical protein
MWASPARIGGRRAGVTLEARGIPYPQITVWESRAGRGGSSALVASVPRRSNGRAPMPLDQRPRRSPTKKGAMTMPRGP